MARDTTQTERCPVCAELTTFRTMTDKPCDSCEVPLLGIVPFQRPIESRHGYRLTIAAEAKTVLRVAYSSKANLAGMGRKS